jgi:methylmalonyl-CoA epimerase
MGVRLDHIGIAVESLDDATAVYSSLLRVGAGEIRRERNEKEQVEIAFVDLPNCSIELLQPTVPTSAIAKYLSSQGEGIHHLCFVASDDLEEECKRLEASAFRIVGKEDGRHFFVHPKDCKGSLIEFYGKDHA